jgi:hypothetical protein
MSFIHPLLLGGIVLVGLPVLLHLIMRQQPKHLIFPAFRFLQLQLRTNQRKLRLRHLLLLLLRMLLIALMCLALARPRLFSDRFGGLGADQAAAVVLVLDTSPSMEYTVAGKTRLDEAKARTLELLDELGEASRVAVLDTGEPGGEWAASPAAARERVRDLQIRAANRPVTDALDAAYALFVRSEGEEPAAEALPRFVYVFSDRTPASWDNARLADLKQYRDRLPDPKPKCIYVDVGVEQPADLAVADIEVKPQVVAANQPVLLNVTVQATGQPYNTELLCRFDGDPIPERKPIDLKPGRQVITFERRGLKVGFHQAEVMLATGDSLPFDNARFVTVEVREPRKVLVVCDEPAEAELWRKAVVNQKLYQCDVKSAANGDVANLGANDLGAYRAVCLVSVRAPGALGSELWGKLEPYVAQGGGVAVAPGGPELDRTDYTSPAALRLLPGELVKLEASKNGAGLTGFLAQHGLAAEFRKWVADLGRVPPLAYLYWDVKPADGAALLFRYDDPEKRPALLERVSEHSNGRGKVLLFTTPMDRRTTEAADTRANNYMKDWYYFAAVNKAVRYLAGEAEDANFNHSAGSSVLVPLPLDRRFPTYTLQGPGLTGADTAVTRPENANELRLTQPKEAGQYTLTGGNREWVSQFSVNVPPAECVLLPRLGAEVVEELFGADSLVALGQNRPLRDALEGQLRQPVELFPWLMLLLLVVLAVENLLANRFYRQKPQVGGEAAGAVASQE